MGYGILAYATLVVLLLTLMPFRFAIPDYYHWSVWGQLADILLNLFLFIPIGFLFRLVVKNHKHTYFLALLYGLCLSTSIELIQLFVPGRFSTLSDIGANGIGAWAGAVLLDVFNTRLVKHPLSRLIAVEYPLMFGLYLLTFLVWLNGADSPNEISRLPLLPILIVIAVRILGSVVAHESIHKSSVRAAQSAALLAFFWFIVASSSALIKTPQQIVLIALIVAVLTSIQVLYIRYRDGKARLYMRYRVTRERRFEIDTLKPLLPLYMLYLLGVSTWPVQMEFSAWRITMPFSYVSQEQWGVQFITVQLFVAFSLFGVFLSEYYARQYASIPWLKHLIYLGGMVGLILFLQGFHAEHRFALVELLIIFSGYLSGMLLYYQQLDAIRRVG